MKRSERLRAIGWLLLAAGLAIAVVVYWLAVRGAQPALDDQTALGYTRSLNHQTGVMMGHFGLILTDWQHTLASPAGQAVLVLAGAALLAGYFFRVAWVLDQEDRDRSAEG